MTVVMAMHRRRLVASLSFHVRLSFGMPCLIVLIIEVIGGVIGGIELTQSNKTDHFTEGVGFCLLFRFL